MGSPMGQPAQVYMAFTSGWGGGGGVSQCLNISDNKNYEPKV